MSLRHPLIAVVLCALAACGWRSGEEKVLLADGGPAGAEVAWEETAGEAGADVGPERVWDEEPGCIPECAGRQCGDDKCGGVCGWCRPGVACLDGQCAPCQPSCAGKECGGDGCGGSCGVCPGGSTCKFDGTCCVPACVGKQCGSDGCGALCGSCPPPGGDPAAVYCNQLLFVCEQPTSSSSGCAEIFDCFMTCAPDDQACFQLCINSAPMEGQMLYEDVMYCLEESGYFDCAWDDEKCRNLAAYMCSNELQKCFGYAE